MSRQALLGLVPSPYITRLADYICLEDRKAAGASGGSSTSGSYLTLDLNTVAWDYGGHVQRLASNQFTLSPGTYYVMASKSLNRADHLKIKLRNITDSVDVLYSLRAGSNTSASFTGRCWIDGYVTIEKETRFELQYRVSASWAGNGLGVETSATELEIYARVELWKQPDHNQGLLGIPRLTNGQRMTDYACLQHQTASGANGGGSSTGWQTRTINTLVSDAGGSVQRLVSNQWHLSPGAYYVRACTCGNRAGRTKCRVRDINRGATSIVGTSEYGETPNDWLAWSYAHGVMIVEQESRFELQQTVGNAQGTNGYGVGTGLSTHEIHAQVELWKDLTWQ